MSSPPAPVAPRSGRPTGRLVAIVVGVIFGVVLLCAAALAAVGYYLASRVEVTTTRDEQGQERTVRINTPFGRLRVDTDRPVDPKLLGIPVYPGATPVVEGERMHARVDLDLDFADTSLRVRVAEVETADPFEQVVDFYREEAVDFIFTKKSRGRVEFIWQQGKLKKVVGIRERGGKTRISLASVGEAEAN